MEIPNEKEITVGGMRFRGAVLKLSILGAVLLFTLFIVGLDRLQTPAPLVAENTAQKSNPFENLTLEARSAYVLDVTTGRVLFAKEEERQLPLASLTKIMTAIVASDIIPNNAIVTISKGAITIEGDSGLKEGDRWRFKNLLDFTLLVSSNDGAGALASAADAFSKNREDVSENFIEKMNSQAGVLGLQQSYYLNESGLDASSEVAGGYGSARDMATLVSFAITKKPHLLEVTAYSVVSFSSEDNSLYDAKNTNPAVDSIPGLIASKTGFTDLAGGNLVIAYDAGINHPIVAVVLGSTLEGRFDDIEKLVQASFENITN